MVREQVDRFTTSDGTQLRVADSGAGDGTGGPTLVLVHGWSQDLRTWDRVVDDLRRTGFAGRILRYDHRGHGGSDAAAEGTATVGRAADDLAALIAERVPEGPLVLAGHSMGGMTLMALAERHPDLVAERVVAVAFVATASDEMDELTLGLPGRRGRLVARGEHVLIPLTARLGHRAPSRRIGTVGRSREHSPRVRASLLAPGVRALVFGRHARRERRPLRRRAGARRAPAERRRLPRLDRRAPAPGLAGRAARPPRGGARRRPRPALPPAARPRHRRRAARRPDRPAPRRRTHDQPRAQRPRSPPTSRGCSPCPPRRPRPPP